MVQFKTTMETLLAVRRDSPAGDQHVEDRFGQRQHAFPVSLPDEAQHHPFRVDGRGGQCDRLADPQAVGVDDREAAAVEGQIIPGTSKTLGACKNFGFLMCSPLDSRL